MTVVGYAGGLAIKNAPAEDLEDLPRRSKNGDLGESLRCMEAVGIPTTGVQLPMIKAASTGRRSAISSSPTSGVCGKTPAAPATSAGPADPKTVLRFFPQTREVGGLECTKLYFAVYNVLGSLYWLAPVGFSWI